ncbi:MAG TPA: hypothetical protein VKG26_01775, partial [Bacteroidia bacterium]|nr:hypothetical protein [Bacteroidia bacterium]
KMKKVSLMVVAALLSASMFANAASLPKKATTAKAVKSKTEMSTVHKQKDKQKSTTTKAKTAHKPSKKAPVKK